MRIQAKRRPPTRRHMQETTDASQLFEDNTALFQEASSSVENSRQTDTDDVARGSFLSAHIPVTQQLDLPDGDMLGPSSIIDAVSTHGDSPAIAVSSTQSDRTVAAPVDVVVSSAVPGDTLSSVSKTQVLKPSSDVDDIFADSSLFATCKCFCVCVFYTLRNTWKCYLSSLGVFGKFLL